MTSDTSGSSIVAVDDGTIRTIQINRPERLNALDPPSIKRLRQEFVRFRDDARLHVCVITGVGSKSFSVGADLSETRPDTRNFAHALLETDEVSIEAGNYIRGLNLARLQIDKPIIAAINGFAVGGGLELALACDIRIASSNATLGLPEVKLGSIPAVGGIQRLIRSVPLSAAMTMILTGASLSAEQALQIGLVSEVLPPDKLMLRAVELASTIANNAPLAVKAALMLATRGLDMTVAQGMVLEELTWGTLRSTEDRIEGRSAFSEKRPAVFKGR
jgi:E-phenylitaconyl-CoA hydratase